MKKISILLIAGLLASVTMQNVCAAVPSVPSGEDLGAQAERFRQEYSIEKRSREKSITKALIEAQEEEKVVSNPGVLFVLRNIKIIGTSVFDAKNLSFIWAPYLDKKVNFNDINNIVMLIKRAYKDLGYLTTTAYLPPQDIKDGVVLVHVVEGKRGSLTVDGNKYFSTPSIEKYFHTFNGEVLDMGELERDVMRLNENKDLNVSSVLSPGKDPETVDVILKAKENLPYHVSVGTDNQGSRLTGRYRRLVTLSDSNLTGNHDTLTFNGAYTDLSGGDYLSYQTPIGTYGAKLGLDAGYFEGKLGQEFKSFDITNYTVFYNPNVSFELYQSQDFQTNLRSGMQIQDIHKRQGVEETINEELRVPYLAFDAIKTDPWGQTTFSPEFNFNAPGFLGGSRVDNQWSSRPGVDEYFFKYDQYVSRNQNMPFGSYIQMKSQFQLASRTLPTSEQFQLGGEGSVRGYPSGDYLADEGWDLDSDWYFPMYLMPPAWQIRGFNLRSNIEPVIFFDMGSGRLLRAYRGERHDEFLAGVGGGVRIHLKNNMYLKLEWAVPTGDKPIRGTGPATFDVAFQAST